MSKSKELKKAAGKIAHEEGLELYWLDYNRQGEEWKVSIFLHKREDNGKIDFDDLKKASKSLGPKIDRIIDHSYILEVSSPGVERFLKTDDHFRKAVGKTVQVDTYYPVKGKKTLTGKLIGVNADVILKTGKEEIEISKKSIASAKMIQET